MSDFASLLQQSFGPKLKEQEPMSLHTTVKIGGPATYYLSVDTLDELVKAVTLAREHSVKVRVFGGGTNILVADDGFDGLVIKNNARKFDVLSMKGTMRQQKMDVEYALVYAESGAITNQVVRFIIDQGLSGLEYSLGLPGTIGGAVFMNANYPKRHMRFGDNIQTARILTKTGEIQEVDREYFHFSPNKSVLQESEDILLSVVFKLLPKDKAAVWELGTEAVTYRSETQPKGVIGGMTFRNIELPDSVSATELVKKAGVSGKRIGNAAIADINPRYILNNGGAKATDVIRLLNEVKHAVSQNAGVQMIQEIEVIH